ncbi:unnamed protein product [Bursaphelenchus okinawaensis]|uniref:Peptidase A1 domain-containing protein n=1 Tax=Bursaphelenchus okinawaensis TaxID=465554 RepID=A0A811L9S4_9BILA|nr:unnamed protein product [Bursaphelenchus okinawaensis]CAG9121702.1 unnamed protein product [Bursaphelenchus okinawaensis]
MIIRVGIGRPVRTFSMQIRLDTRYMFVFDVKCLASTRCGNVENHQLYNSRLSSTARDLNLPMQVSDTAMGNIVEDEVSIEHYLTLRHQLGSAFKSTEVIHSAEGVLGLQQGPNLQSPFNNLLRHVSSQQFTVLTQNVGYYNEVIRNSGNIGYVSFGETDVVNCGRDYTTVQSVNSSSWNFRINRFQMADFYDQNEYLATVEPSEAYTLVPRKILLQILSIVKAKPVASNITTYTVHSTDNLPLIQLQVGSYGLVWEPRHYLMGNRLAMMLNPHDGVMGYPSWVFGNNFLKQYCVAFQPNQLTFSKIFGLQILFKIKISKIQIWYKLVLFYCFLHC